MEVARKAAGLRLCRRCGEEKPADDFHRGASECKPCHIARQRAYEETRKDDPDHIAARRKATREWFQRNPDYLREQHLRRKFGIGAADYDRMLEAQGGRCAICQLQPRRRYLAVDHNHSTGAVRGLLCDPCNHGLGNFLDDPDLLRRALAYLV